MRDEEAVRLLVGVTVKELVATVVSDSDIDCEAIHVFDSDSLLVDDSDIDCEAVHVFDSDSLLVDDSDIDCEAIHVFDSDSLLVDEFVGDTRCLDAEPLLEIVLLLDGVRDGLTLPDRVRVIVVEVVASSLVVLVLL